MGQTTLIDLVLARARVDLASAAEPPSVGRVIVVSALSIVISVGVDAAIVKLATVMYPAIHGYSHFRLIDYGALTVLGVLAACAAWSAVVRISSSPRWLFFRLVIIVMTVLWVPDLWLIAKHEPTRAVFALMLMHLAVALVTYNLLVHFATGRFDALENSDHGSSRAFSSTSAVPAGSTPTPDKGPIAPVVGRIVWVTMVFAVTGELLVGLTEIVFVPLNRPDGWFAKQGEALSLAHALLGGALGLGAIVIFTVTLRNGRLERIAALTGLIGLALGAIGGVLTYDRTLRLWGMGLMFLGVAVAFFGYLVPLIGESPGLPPNGFV